MEANSIKQPHPVHAVYDGIFNTFTGKEINIHALNYDMFCLEDMAKGLSNICRFGGQIPVFYSVAKHTLLVWYLAPTHLKRAALAHDLAEAYVNDMIKPLKVQLGESYRSLEELFEAMILKKYKVSKADVAAIKPFDMMALDIEHQYFRYDNRGSFTDAFHHINCQLGTDKTAYHQLLGLLKQHFGTYE